MQVTISTAKDKSMRDADGNLFAKGLNDHEVQQKLLDPRHNLAAGCSKIKSIIASHPNLKKKTFTDADLTTIFFDYAGGKVNLRGKAYATSTTAEISKWRKYDNAAISDSAVANKGPDSPIHSKNELYSSNE
jgi:Cft2 family RNA processing exonuclease